MISLGSKLKDFGIYDKVGGMDYLMNLTSKTITIITLIPLNLHSSAILSITSMKKTHPRMDLSFQQKIVMIRKNF